jgi:teichuronic acid biosynthesis glycosyltransferase TuaG
LHLNKEQAGSDREPTVSIIVPAFNAAKYISKAIQSALEQTFTDHEIIVINDGSPDTAELEMALASFQNQIRYITQANKGPSGSRNTGIRAARGEYIAFMDADDYWLPNYLRCQMEYLSRDSSLDLIYADALLIGSSPLAGRTFMQATPSKGAVTCESLLAEACTIILSGTVVRRQPVLDAGLFDENFRYAEDFDLWVRLLKQGSRFAYQRKVLLHRNENGEGLSSNTTVLFENALSVIDKIKRRSDLTLSEQAALAKREEKLRAAINLENAKSELQARRFTIAAEKLASANRYYRSLRLYCALLCLRSAPVLLLRIYNSLRRRPPIQTELDVA